jgi:hypothetical protein
MAVGNWEAMRALVVLVLKRSPRERTIQMPGKCHLFGDCEY